MAVTFHLSSLFDRFMQIFSRPAALQTIMLSLFSTAIPLIKDDSSSSSPSITSIEPPSPPPKGTLAYHAPPIDEDGDDPNKHYYDDNWTVFGKILRGESPAVTYAESDDLLAFEDMHERAPLHGLIIPKRFIGGVFDLSTPTDLKLLEEMQHMAEKLLHDQHPAALLSGDYTLCFHIPPFNSVDHLHLHVLAPASEMKTYFRFIKYQVGTLWCTSLKSVMERLRAGKTAVPYKRPTRKTPLVDFLY
jgi:diadenosine tetraphosphate (Ap4A) HIT family hydrolase